MIENTSKVDAVDHTSSDDRRHCFRILFWISQYLLWSHGIDYTGKQHMGVCHQSQKRGLLPCLST